MRGEGASTMSVILALAAVGVAAMGIGLALIIKYLSDIANNVDEIGYLIWHIARDQGWIEEEEEEGKQDK